MVTQIITEMVSLNDCEIILWKWIVFSMFDFLVWNEAGAKCGTVAIR